MADPQSLDGRLRSLAMLAAVRPVESIASMLAAARERLGLEACCLTHIADGHEFIRAIDGDAASFGLQRDQGIPVPESFGQRLVDGRIGSVIPDASTDLRVMSLGFTQRGRVGGFIGVPVLFSDSSVYGALWAMRHSPQFSLDTRDVEFLQILARLMADEIERTYIRTEKERLEIDRIRHVLSDGSLSMVFQPIISLQEGTLAGVEALARFGTEPERSPDSWFAEAGSIGLRLDLELLAVSAALAQLGGLPAGVYLSVNASPETVMSPQLLSMLDQAIGGVLVIEVTEHTAVEDYVPLKQAIARIRERGARLAVDDTGAGFASLAHIHKLVPDIIKLDVSLTKDIDSDPVRRSLATSLISFASQIEATIIAEGIETAAEEDTLRALGVGFGQGWYLARPGPLSDATRVVPFADMESRDR